MHLPSTFCWSRFGAEAGETIDSILSRKNLERALNAGCFTWGIGTALGSAMNDLVQSTDDPTVLFSPIVGPATPADANPTNVVAWLSYLGSNGERHKLPAGALITSRAPHHGILADARHYALFAFSSVDLTLADNGSVDIGHLVNLTTENAIGSSQTTAIVAHRPERLGVRTYPVLLKAQLRAPYAARLTDPVLLTDADRAAIHALNRTSDSFAAFVDELAQRATAAPDIPRQVSLF